MNPESVAYRRVRAALISILAVLSARAFAADVPNETVRFEIDHLTAPGQSVFVLGDRPELGGGDMTRAVKLVPGQAAGGSLPWSIDIALPQGVNYAYQFVVRADAISQLSNPANGSPITSSASAATSPPDPPRRDLVIYFPAALGVTAVDFLTDQASVTRPVQPLPGEPTFVFSALFDQPSGVGIRAQFNAIDIDTPLHSVLARSRWHYNYVPVLTGFPLDDLEVFALPTTLIPATRTVNNITGRGVQVYLPRQYNVHTLRRYPVLYMHDGQNVFGAGGPFGSWGAEDVAGSLISDAQIRELIIVAIDNSSQRLNEYNPEWGSNNTQNAAYNQFIVSELKPHVDAHYRTLPGPDDTGVLGSSFGGVASLVLGLEFPEVFGNVGAMSTSFWASTTDDQLADGDLPMSSTLYLDAGDVSDGTAETIAARDGVLRTGRVLHDTLHFTIGYGHAHNEAAWNARLPGVLLALFPIEVESSQIDLPAPIAGDVDSDCTVGLADLSAVLEAFGSCAGEPAFDPVLDLDADGCIGLGDLSALLTNFGLAC